MRSRGLLLLLFAIGCGAADENAERPSHESTPRAEGYEIPAAESRHQLGGYVIYRYDGTYTEEPITLEEHVTEVDGLRLAIAVRATRGDESREWIQVVTDTEENRQNNVLDELYEVVDGERRPLSVVGPQEIVRLYGWTLPSCGAQGDPSEAEPREISIGSTAYECSCVRARTTCDDRAATVEACECSDFVWGHAYGEVQIDGSDESPLWRVQVVESGVR